MQSILLIVLQLLWFAIIGRVVISWLLIAGMRGSIVLQIDYALSLVTEPLMKPLRKVIPPIGSIDIVPMVAIIIVIVLIRIVGRA